MARPSDQPFEPPHRFSSDAHTLALWDFNDTEGVDRFEDESGNGYILIGMNGATTGSALAVGRIATRNSARPKPRHDSSRSAIWQVYFRIKMTDAFVCFLAYPGTIIADVVCQACGAFPRGARSISARAGEHTERISIRIEVPGAPA